MIKRPFTLALATLLLAAVACSLPSLPLSPPTVDAPRSPTNTPSPTLPPTAASSPTPAGALSLAELYQRVNPGVVTIWTFGDLGPPHTETIPLGQGSGFVIDLEGHIVTNQHVIQDAQEVEVDFPSGERAWAEIVGVDPDSDLAILKVEVPTSVLVPLPLGDSGKVRVGDPVVAIGNPFGLTGTMTQGIVSAIGRTLESEHAAPGGGLFSAGSIIQTDTAINPGNSGGPLLNLGGEVIGVNRAIRTETFTTAGSPTNSGIGFAVPVNILRRVAPSLIAKGKYEYPYLGISSLSDEVMNLKVLEALDLPSDAHGAYVSCVAPGSPAAQAGLRGAGPCNEGGLLPGGDLIIAIDGQPVRQFGDLLSYLIANTQPGQEVILTVLREGAELDIPLTIGARP
jgi:2-alkenal reductase